MILCFAGAKGTVRRWNGSYDCNVAFAFYDYEL